MFFLSKSTLSWLMVVIIYNFDMFSMCLIEIVFETFKEFAVDKWELTSTLQISLNKCQNFVTIRKPDLFKLWIWKLRDRYYVAFL